MIIINVSTIIKKRPKMSEKGSLNQRKKKKALSLFNQIELRFQ